MTGTFDSICLAAALLVAMGFAAFVIAAIIKIIQKIWGPMALPALILTALVILAVRGFCLFWGLPV